MVRRIDVTCTIMGGGGAVCRVEWGRGVLGGGCGAVYTAVHVEWLGVARCHSFLLCFPLFSSY